MSTRNLAARLRKVETERRPSLPLQGTVIVAVSAAEADRIRAEREAAGTHRPGWPLIVVTSSALATRRLNG